ncbi:restriction endonuclease [Alphaproteobacteria bacterium GH1-50]|uniref:Restriction endonuclease n=1 Tax=Kangsaoukella pontilimi TaxID=2691042 RepID=A0A7C9NF80_9RHOB|nr:BglII/BstYI family type II restriction endonuclease [Kangsaoukella pontilimi]MXQ08659.1 restriction endonuclease [Kangsaoukella pontilimi]
MLSRLTNAGFDVLACNHAEAILAHDFPTELDLLTRVLAEFRISLGEIVTGGGGEAGPTQRLRHELSDLNWRKHNFTIETVIDGRARAGVSHEVDHVKFAEAGALALEIEWNNKDPFFDRDLENFQRLHALSAISVGIVVTRGASLQESVLPRVTAWMEARGLTDETDLDALGIAPRTVAQRRAVAEQVARGASFPQAFARKFVADKFGQATTHWSKLEDRVLRGVGNPCPLLLIGLPDGLVTDD